jgi:hypothetical protein
MTVVCLMDSGQDIKLKINVLQVTHFIVALMGINLTQMLTQTSVLAFQCRMDLARHLGCSCTQITLSHAAFPASMRCVMIKRVVGDKHVSETLPSFTKFMLLTNSVKLFYEHDIRRVNRTV